jgi:hypothetical protein
VWLELKYGKDRNPASLRGDTVTLKTVVVNAMVICLSHATKQPETGSRPDLSGNNRVQPFDPPRALANTLGNALFDPLLDFSQKSQPPFEGDAVNGWQALALKYGKQQYSKSLQEENHHDTGLFLACGPRAGLLPPLPPLVIERGAAFFRRSSRGLRQRWRFHRHQ